MKIEELTSRISESSIVVASHEQISSDVGGEIVILDLKSGVYHGLNEVGTRVWSLIQQPIFVQDIQQTLIQEYEVEPEICIQDLLILLNDLEAVGLVEMKNETIT